MLLTRRSLRLGFLAGSLSLAGVAVQREITVDPMAGTANWQLGGRRINYVLGQSEVSESRDQLRPGAAASLKLKYDFREPHRDYLSAYWTGGPIPGRCESVSFWLFGDHSGRPVSLAIEDAAERWYQTRVGKVDWDGWKQVTVPVGDGSTWRALRRRGDAPQPLQHPVALRQIMIEQAPDAPAEGVIYLHDLRAQTDVEPLDGVVANVTTDRPANLFYTGESVELTVVFTHSAVAPVTGTVGVGVLDFFGARAELASQPVTLAPGLSTRLTFRYAATRTGAFTAEVCLASGGRNRVWFRRFAVSHAGQEPSFAELGTFGCCAAISGFGNQQLDTVWRLDRDAGIRWERLSFDWRAIEPAAGRFAWDPPPTVPGAKGRALSGPSSLATTSDPRLSLQDGVTLAFWLRADKTPGEWQWPILKYADPPYRNYGVFLHKDTGVASFTAGFERGGRSPYFGVSSGWSPWDGQWHHFAATYSAESGSVILYVDGREVKREALDGGRLQTGPEAVRLGSTYRGELDEVVVCDRALPPERIAALAAKADPETADGLVGWWSFDDPNDPGADRGPAGLTARAAADQEALSLPALAQSHGMRVLGILGFPPAWASTAPPGAARPWVYKPQPAAWERYVEATVRHLAGTVDHWEIWNEPNISVFWEPQPSPAAFLDVVRTGYAAAKRANPACTVLTPGLAGAGDRGDTFLTELIRNGVTAHCDAISIHPYRQTTPEESDLVGDLTRIADLCERHGGKRPLWITEWCWTTEIGGGSTEERSAIMTGRGIALALGTGLVDRLIWFRLADPGVDRFYSEHNYGLCSADLTPKPAYFAFRTCARLLDGARPEGELKLGAGVWARQFGRGQEHCLALWHPDGRAMVALDTGKQEAGVVDLMGNERTVPTRNGVLFVEVSERLQFLRLAAPPTAALVPVELRTPHALLLGEPGEAVLVLRNPSATTAEFSVALTGLVETQVAAQVPARGSKEVAIPLRVPAAAGPGPKAVNLAVRLDGLTWAQSATVVLTSVRPGPNLVGHWAFDEGQGTVAHDATANGNHGTISGCQWVPGRKGPALAFSGSSAVAVGGPAGQAPVTDLLVIPDAPALNLPEEVTVAFWLRLTGDTGTWQFPVAKFQSNLARNYGMYIRPTDFAACFSTSFVEGAAPHSDLGGGPNLNDGQWHHLAATCALAAGQMHVYVDGRKVSSQSFTPEAMKTVAEPLRVGAGTHGVIDEVRVYGKALAPEEVAELAK